jgi:valyl-tRNA synthetase
LFLNIGREFRQQQQLKNSEAITRLMMPKEIFGETESIYAIIRKQLNCTKIEFREGSYSGESGIQVIPFLSHQIGFESQKKLDDPKRKVELEKELSYYKGFLESLNKKLSNEQFVLNAKPEVIDLEKKKKTDTEEKIAAILLTLKV